MEGAELRVWVLVPDASLKRSHGLLGRHRLGPDDVGDFEIEGDVLTCIALAREATWSTDGERWKGAYRLLLVALSICSSRAELAEDDHQLIILTDDDNHSSREGVGQAAGARCRGGSARGGENCEPADGDGRLIWADASVCAKAVSRSLAGPGR